jgi:hypothetical protein
MTTTSTISINAVGIALTQKPDTPEVTVYWLEVEDPTTRDQLKNFVHTSYEEDLAQVQQAINEGFATLISVTDHEVL